GDGNSDMAFQGQVFLSNGDGTFREPGDLGAYSYHWAVADFDADGNLDLAGTDFRVVVLRGNGDGTFQPAQLFSAGSYRHSLNAADVNRDGVLDIVMVNGSADEYVTALLGNGDGTFGPPVRDVFRLPCNFHRCGGLQRRWSLGRGIDALLRGLRHGLGIPQRLCLVARRP